MAKKHFIDPGLQYLRDIGFERIKGKYGLNARLYTVFGRQKAEQILHRWERITSGSREFYDFKNSDPELSRAISEAYDDDIIRKSCNYIDAHKHYFGKTILEVGCDCGIISCFLAKTFPDATIVSIDRCVAAIENAREFAKKQGIENVTFINCDLKDIEKTFDTVFSMRTVHENYDAVEDIVNDLGEQAEIFKEALVEYAQLLSNALTDQGKLISVERIGRNALLLGWMKALKATNLSFDLSCYEELECIEDGRESVFQAFVCFKNGESEIDSKDLFDFACSKYLDYSQAQYKGWDAKIVFENRRGMLIEGYTIEYLNSPVKSRISLWTHNADETCLIAYENIAGNPTTTFLDVSEKENILDSMHKQLDDCRAHVAVTITKMTS